MKIFQGSPVSLNKKTRKTIGSVYGLGLPGTMHVLAFAGIQRQCSNLNVLQEQYTIMNMWFSNQPMFGNTLLFFVKQKRGREIFMKTVKGTRVSAGLPINGQRTRSNAKTAKKLQLSSKFVQESKLNT